jgi:hypothetical protein
MQQIQMREIGEFGKPNRKGKYHGVNPELLSEKSEMLAKG